MRLRLDQFATVTRNAPTAPGSSLADAAAGVAPPPPADATPPPPPADATPPPPPADAPLYAPEGLPDTLKGLTDHDTIDKLWQAEVARAKPPEAADQYELTITDQLKGVIDPATDAVLPHFQAVALEHGLTQPQYQGVIEGFYARLSEAGMIAQPVDAGAELAKLSDGKGDIQAQIRAGAARFGEAASHIESLAKAGSVSKETAEALISFVDGSATNVIAFEAIAKLFSKGNGLANVSGGTQQGDLSPDAARAAALRRMYPTMAAAE